MLTRVHLTNFGPLASLNWSQLGQINLIVGENGSGKTFLLKALYCAMRTLEEYKRGNEQRTASEILADKLYWTFQPDRIGDLVSKGADAPMKFMAAFNELEFSYSFGKDTAKQIAILENHIPPRKTNSIFLPAKEVLSLQQIILTSRERDKAFGFDDTYFDLAKALRQMPRGGKNFAHFADSRKKLEDILGGKIEFDVTNSRWLFKKGNQKFPIGVTAEGIKKIAILDTLLGNRYLDNESVVLIDEPESALHPAAISKFLDIVAILARYGIQFFMASHSYFVVKKLSLLAKANLNISVITGDKDGWRQSNLRDERPDNSIIDESIRLYEEELEAAFP